MRLFSGERQRNTGGTHLERRGNCDGTARVYNGCQQAGNAPGDYVREQIRIARTLTDCPIGVNVMLMSPYAGQVAEAAAEEKVAVVTTGAGHVGELTTMVLVPQVCDAAGGLPRDSRCVYAGRLRCADGHPFSQRGGMHHSSRLPGVDGRPIAFRLQLGRGPPQRPDGSASGP